MKTEGLSEAEINAKHAEKMRRKKEARDTRSSALLVYGYRYMALQVAE